MSRVRLHPPHAKYVTRVSQRGKSVHDAYSLADKVDEAREREKTAIAIRPDLANKIDFARGTASEFGDIVSNHPATKLTRYALGKEAGIGSALRTFGGGAAKKLRGIGGGISSRARGAFIRGPKKVGLVNAAGYGGLAGAGLGAVHGAMTAEPGESRMQAAMGGAKRGAMVGAGAGLVGRHFVNQNRVKQHAIKHNLPHLLKTAEDDNVISLSEQVGPPPRPAPGYQVPNSPLKMHRTGGEKPNPLNMEKKRAKMSGVGNENYSGSVDDQGYA